jgi:precorrin-2 dehydrogenase/sirohydrochlorin ferrochelatase
VASRRVRGLLSQNARVRVVAPNIGDEIEHLARSGEIEIRTKKFSADDLDGAFIVHATTSDHAVNLEVAEAAAQRGQLVCCADDAGHGNFLTPSTFSRGDLTVSVTTGGASPTFATVLRERLEAWLGPEYEQWTELFGKLRPTIQSLGSAAQRTDFVSRILDDDEVCGLILAGDIDAAETAARRCI